MIIIARNNPRYPVFYHGTYSISLSTEGLRRRKMCVGIVLFGYRITLILPLKATRLYMTADEWRELMREDL